MVLTKRANAKLSPEKTVKEEVKKPTAGKRSPGRPRSPARQKSPSRTKSETREKSPSRRKSGGAVTKSAQRSGKLTPTRRSPIRKAASVLEFSDEELKDTTPLLIRRSKVIEIETKLEIDHDKAELKRKPRSSSRTRTKNDTTNKIQDHIQREMSVESNSSTLLKRVTRSSQNREVERIVHLKNFENLAKKLSEFSDEEEKPVAISKVSKSSYEYSNTVGLLFVMVFLPVLVLAILVQCSYSNCSYNPITNLKHISFVFSDFLKSFLAYFSYFTFVTWLSLLPWGVRVSNLPDKQEKRIYRMNGFLTVLILIVVLFALEGQHIPIAEFVLKHFLYLYVSALVMGLSISSLAYLRSFYVPVSTLNPSIINKGNIFNFFVGRELHPRIFGLDWKLLVIRSAIITKVLIDLCLLGNKLELYVDFSERAFNLNLNNLTPTFIVYFTLSTIFVFDGLIFEYTRVTSKELQQEAFGYYMGVSYLITPFVASLTTKYILENNVQLPYWQLGLVTAIFLVGYLIYRGSNNQKDSFRKNPYSPSFSRLESLPTTQGKKLLCSGFWGLVRHPNYLGHILIELSTVPFVLKTPLLLIVLLRAIFLIHRAVRDNNHCKQKYGTAWDRYCNKVGYYLIPKVF